MRLLLLLLCAVAPPAALASVSLSLIPGTLSCIVDAAHPGSAGNAYGYEDGSVRRIGASLHMLVSEEWASPKWVGMRLAHWTTAAPGGDANWTRVGVLVLDGAPMVSSRNCSDVVSHAAALWSPTAFYDDAMTPSSRSAAQGARGALLALYGSSDGDSYWSVGLASSPSGAMRGPWVRAPAGNPLQINAQRTENPIVLQVGPAAWLAVYDSIRSERDGFGLTWSPDGRDWAQGVLVPVPGGVRAPMAALAQDDGSVLIIFNRQGAFDALWAARFALNVTAQGQRE